MSNSTTNDQAANVWPSLVAPIGRVDAPTPETFRGDYLARNRPVIITGAMTGWQALDKWDLAYLRAALAGTPLRAYMSPDGAFRAEPTHGFHESLWVNLTGEQYVDWISAGRRSPHLLVQHQSIITKLTQLQQDIRIPLYVDRTRVRDVNFWLGAGDNITPLHCDQADNLLAQVVGEKRIILAAPSRRTSLYPHNPLGIIPPVTNRVNTMDVDPGRCPRFREVQFLDGRLVPGEMLFIPVHWWHEVHGVGINVSVNFWWEASIHNPWRHPAYMLATYISNSSRELRVRFAGTRQKIASHLLSREVVS